MKELKPKKCKSCKAMFKPFSSLAKVCSMACSLDYIGTEKQKAEAKKARDFDRETKERRAKFKAGDLSHQKKLCQDVFNKLRRLQEFKWFSDRGIEPTCISCGKPKGGDQWCNGHFKTVGAQSGLRFDPINSYLQHNRHCNRALSGDIYGTKHTHGYIQGLKNRFGEEEALRIIEHCETNTETVKWTCEQLEAMRKEWNAEIRKLEKELA